MGKFFKYRVFAGADRSKASHIVEHRKEAEAVLPKDRPILVKRYSGRKKLATYMVEWQGNAFRWTTMSND